MQTLLAARTRPYADVEDLWRRADAPVSLLERLAAADVFAGLGLSRRDALWQVKRLKDTPLPLFEHARRRDPDLREYGLEPAVVLPDLLPGEQVVEDYATLRLTLREHPMALLRPHLVRERLTPAARLTEMKNGAKVTVAGLAVCRQRPGSANGVLFVTLEDETGIANCIVWPALFEAQRREAIRSRLLAIEGTVQMQDAVVHVVAKRLIDMTPRLRALAPEEATLEHAPARADVTRHTKPLKR
jgi:error-prone DNA polymerase